MVDRCLSIVAACGLLIALAGILPLVPAHAATGSGCSGSCPKITVDGVKQCDPDDSGDCSGTNCGCKTVTRGCDCKT
jgi:hypothetical protein